MGYKITYKLEVTENEDKIRRAIHADNAYHALWEIREYVHGMAKHNDMVKIDDIEEKVADIIECSGVDLERDWT